MPKGHCAGRLGTVSQCKTPRFFGLDPAANFLHATNQDSDTVGSFRVNQGTGRPAPTGQVVKVGSPVCIILVGG